MEYPLPHVQKPVRAPADSEGSGGQSGGQNGSQSGGAPADRQVIEIWTRLNGEAGQRLSVETGGQVYRPAPGHFGQIETADEGQVLKPLFPQSPDFP